MSAGEAVRDPMLPRFDDLMVKTSIDARPHPHALSLKAFQDVRELEHE